jgi:hypothetical protein
MTTKISGTSGVEFPTGGTQKAAAERGPSFSAYLTGDSNIPSNAHTVAPINGVEWDGDASYNVTTYRYTPKVAGKWRFTGQILFNSLSVGSAATYVATIYKNGAVARRGTSCVMPANYADAPHCYVSALVDMNGTTDYVELRCYNGSGSALLLKVLSAKSDNYFQGELVERAA